MITTAFEVAAKARLRVLGMEQHSVVAMQHPLASRSESDLREMASELARQVVKGLTAE